MLKKFLLFICVCLVFTFSFYFIKVDAYLYNEIDFGDYDSYTDSDYGYDSTYTIRDYDMYNNPLFGSNAYFSGYIIEGKGSYEKCYYILDDDPIVNFVPKSLFTTRGNTLFVGEEYGFYVDCHYVLNNAMGTYDGIYEVDVFIFDITVNSGGTRIEFEVTPLYTYTYVYVDPYYANLRQYPGIRVNSPFNDPSGVEQYNDFYYLYTKDTPENNNKASTEGLVAPYPYSTVNPYPNNAGEYSIEYCNRAVAKRYQSKYVIGDVYNYVYAENINYYNIFDAQYDLSEDNGFAFQYAYTTFKGGYPKEEPASQEEFLLNGLKNICYEKIYDEFGNLIKEYFDVAWVEDILDLIELLKDNYENNKAIEDYISNPAYDVDNEEYKIEIEDALFNNRQEDILDGELLKSMFFYFNNLEKDNPIYFYPGRSEEHYIKFAYNGYFGENNMYRETLIKYVLDIQVLKYNDSSNGFVDVGHDCFESKFRLDNSNIEKQISLSLDDNVTIYNGYYIDGYYENLSFQIFYPGIYYFNIQGFDLEIHQNDEALDINDSYEFNLGDTIKIKVFHNSNFGSYSLEIIRNIQFELIVDPEFEKSGTEFKINPNESKQIIHVGNTRLLFLGENAPIDLYESRLDYVWTSDDSSKATVSIYGTVFAKNPGYVTITASIGCRYTAEIIFQIVENDENSAITSFSISLDTSSDPSVPNGTMLTYVPTDSDINNGYDYGPGGFDIKLGYTRCIFINNGPSPYRQDYIFEVNMTWGGSQLPISVSQYGTIILNHVLRGYVVTVNITCTYKYNSNYVSTFTVRLIGT